MKQRTYIAIYLKLFYASVVCCERELDSMDTNLVVADEIRTNKTGFLAVTLSLKKYGIFGRGRLFEVNHHCQGGKCKWAEYRIVRMAIMMLYNKT